VFCCARLNPAKGHRFLIEAIDLLRQEKLPIALEIAGEDDVGGHGHRLELQALIRSHGLESHVKLLGAVPEEVVRERLMRAHVFALASLEEPLGVAIMEAMSMEVPVVATNAGGVPELVSNGVDGLLVEPGDAAAIARAIKAIATRRDLAATLSARGRTKVLDRFSSRRSAEAIARLVPGD
jgi:glycosyltransferase involved in cell wall biosynthesis